MDNRYKYIIEKVAQKARQMLIEHAIISENDDVISEEQIPQIVKFFGGEVKKNNSIEYAEIKKTDESFIIYYNDYSSPLDIFHELGHAFFDIKNIPVDNKLSCNGIGEEDEKASLFSRSFYMPRESFEKITIKFSNNGTCNVNQVANIYKVKYCDILTRGQELNIWS